MQIGFLQGLMKKRFCLITLLILVLDHATKMIVSSNLRLGDALVVVPGFLRLSYVRNSGVAFGLFQDIQSIWKPYILGAMAVAAVIVIVVYSTRTPTNRLLLQLSLAVTTGGILGNFADRIVHKYVVDFIEFHIYDSFHWPTFNLADMAITIGIAMLLIDTLKNPEKGKEELRVSTGAE